MEQRIIMIINDFLLFYRSSDNPPSLAVLSHLTQQCQPVPLKFALIADGTITINSLLDVEVPTYSR